MNETLEILLKYTTKTIVSIGINVVLAYFFPIHTGQCYGWSGGIWHGMTIIGNWILSFFKDGRLLIASCHTNAYHVWYWIFLVLAIVGIALNVIAFIALPIKAIIENKRN